MHVLIVTLYVCRCWPRTSYSYFANSEVNSSWLWSSGWGDWWDSTKPRGDYLWDSRICLFWWCSSFLPEAHCRGAKLYPPLAKAVGMGGDMLSWVPCRLGTQALFPHIFERHVVSRCNWDKHILFFGFYMMHMLQTVDIYIYIHISSHMDLFTYDDVFINCANVYLAQCWLLLLLMYSFILVYVDM